MSDLDDLRVNYEDEDDNTEINDSEPIEEVYEEPKRTKKKIKKKVQNKPLKTRKNKGGKKINILPIIAVGAVIVVGAIAYIIYTGNKEDPKPVKQVNEQETVQQDPNKKKEDVGAPSLYRDNVKQNNSEVVNETQFIKDLDGNKINAKYDIDSIEGAKRDFVDYKKKRYLSDQGMEINYLEVTYKGKKYFCQVPLSISKELDNEHIAVAEMEVATTKDGKKIITYMRIPKDQDINGGQ